MPLIAAQPRELAALSHERHSDVNLVPHHAGFSTRHHWRVTQPATRCGIEKHAWQIGHAGKKE